MSLSTVWSWTFMRTNAFCIRWMVVAAVATS